VLSKVLSQLDQQSVLALRLSVPVRQQKVKRKIKHMIRFSNGLASLVFAFAAALGVLAQDITSGAGAIRMTATKYAFSPNTVRVKKGGHVRLVITALDRDHGFKLDAFQIDQKLPKGEAVTIDFTADRSGTFPFQCSEVCGLGHKKMKGELIIE
jgi:heme/copper-type cytochrome/quinol oxidase subunit 2